MNEIQLIDTTQFHELQRAGHACVVDVRNHDEFSRGSAARLCWPVGDIDAASVGEFARQQKLAPDQTLVLLCASGKRAQMAAAKLRELIPNPIAVLQGGHAALDAAAGKSRMSIERQVRIAAGLLIVIGSVATLFASPAAILLCLFVGAGLVVAGLTDSCLMGRLIMRMPWNRG
ncbi:MAG: inner membrane protein YgaP [Pseudomonadota bacterium]|jgi:rhodanese-related sulfurtransferase